MIEFLKSWVMNIVTLAIFIVLFEMLIPSGKIKKIVNLISGFILILAIISPVITLIHKDFNFNDIQITDSNLIDTKEIEADSKVFQDKQMKQISEIYRQKLIGELESCAQGVKGVSSATGDVIINEDYNSSNFGEVKRAYVKFSKKSQKNTGVTPIVEIERIQIDTSTSSEKENNTVDTDSKAIESEIKTEIKNKLGIPKEKIVLSEF